MKRREKRYWEAALWRGLRQRARLRGEPFGWYFVGVCLMRLGRPAEALGRFERAVTLDPKSGTFRFERGNALFDLGRYAEAVDAYGRTLEGGHDELRPVAFYNRALAGNNLGETETAIRDCDEALALRPDYADARNNRGNLLNDAGRYAEALSDFDRGIALEPEDSTIHGNRATALVGLRRYEEALEACERALGIDRRNRTALYEKARALVGLGRVDEAVLPVRWAVQGDVHRSGDAKNDPDLTPVWSRLHASDSTSMPR